MNVIQLPADLSHLVRTGGYAGVFPGDGLQRQGGRLAPPGRGGDRDVGVDYDELLLSLFQGH